MVPGPDSNPALELGRILVTPKVKESCLPHEVLPLIYQHSRTGEHFSNAATPSASHPKLPVSSLHRLGSSVELRVTTEADRSATIVSLESETDLSAAGSLESWISTSGCRSCG